MLMNIQSILYDLMIYKQLIQCFENVISSSGPFIRALQTAEPLAVVFNERIKVEYNFCEILATPWLFKEDPLKELNLVTNPSHPVMPSPSVIDSEYVTSGIPEVSLLDKSFIYFVYRVLLVVLIHICEERVNGVFFVY